MPPPSITFLVTYKEVPEKSRLTLSGDEARNCLESAERTQDACEIARQFINDYYGSDVVQRVEVEA